MELRVASALQAWAADPTAIPPAILAAINEHVRQDSRPCLLLDLPDALLAYVLSKLPARLLGPALQTCRSARRALPAVIQMRAQLLGLATKTLMAAAMATTRDLHFAEVDSLLQPEDGVGYWRWLPAADGDFVFEPRPRKDFHPTNDADLLRDYTYCFEFYHLEATFTKDPTGPRVDVQRTATGRSVKILSLTPSPDLSDDQVSQLSQLFHAARDCTAESIEDQIADGTLNHTHVTFGPFICAKLVVHCHRTNQFRVLLDSEWETFGGGERNVVNGVGFTHFRADVTGEYKATFNSNDEEGDDVSKMDIDSQFELQMAVMTNFDAAAENSSCRRDEPHTPEVVQVWEESALGWQPFEKPLIMTAFLIDDEEVHGLRDLARLIDGCFDRPHTYSPLCTPLPPYAA